MVSAFSAENYPVLTRLPFLSRFAGAQPMSTRPTAPEPPSPRPIRLSRTAEATGLLDPYPRRVRLVAIDLDGTLLNQRKAITPRTQRALHRAVNRGVQIVLATARPPRSVRYYYQALRLSSLQINYNGALIWDEKQKHIISHRPLDLELARKAIAFARRRYRDIMVSVEILDKWYTDHYSDVPEYTTETAKHFSPDFVGPLKSFLTVPVTKVMFLGKPEWVADLEARIPQKFGYSLSHTRSDPHLLQIMARGVNKGVALRALADRLHIDLADTMAIGDAPNDVEMLQTAGTAVAMGNAWPELRAVARYAAPTNEEDGVAVALERFVLTAHAAV